MCRHLAYLGPAQPLSALVLDAPHSLRHQSYAPQEQSRGVVNADGFGVGWFAPHIRPEPARYRSVQPIWADRSFASFAPVVSSGAVVASVRSATPPNPVEASGVAPYTSGSWLFSHNGSLDGFRLGPDGKEGVRRTLLREVSTEHLAGIDGASDSELLFALVLDHLASGDPPAAALTRTVDRAAELADARLNFILCDGHDLFATAVGESLYIRCDSGAVTVASEPPYADPAWERVPDRSLVEATAGSAKVGSL